MANGEVTPGWAQPGGHSAKRERAVVYAGEFAGGVRLTVVRGGTGKRILIDLPFDEACELLRVLDNSISEAIK